MAAPDHMTTGGPSSASAREAVIAGLGVAVILLAGLAVRVLGWREFFFSPDDVLHLYIAGGRDLGEVMARSAGQVHPPLIFVILHFMLRASRDEYFLRCVSLVPNLVTIVAACFLGRRLGSVVFGLALSYFIAFSNAAIVQSQIIRPYSLLVMLVVLSLLALVSYFQTGKTRYLIFFFALILIETLLHYSSVIANCAIGAAWLGRTAFHFRAARKADPKAAGAFLKTELTRVAAVFIPIVATLMALYLVHLSGIVGSSVSRDLKASYLSPFFFSTPAGMVKNLGDLFSFFTFFAYYPAVMALAAVGAVYLAVRGDRVILAACLMAMALSIALAFLHVYPFGGSRHSMVLLPFVAVLTGAGVEALRAGLSATADAVVRWKPVDPDARKRAADYALLFAVGLAAVAHFSYFSGTWKGLRQLNTGEFVVRRKVWNEVHDYLMTRTGPGDVTVANWQSFVYLYYLYPDAEVFKVGPSRIELWSPAHGLVYCPQPDGCFWSCLEEISNSVQAALDDQRLNGRRGGGIYIMDVGWPGPYSFWQDPRLHWALEPVVFADHEHLFRINSFGMQP